MDDYLKNIDIDHLRRAVQAEEKYKYININGRESTFAGFMIKQLNKIYKLSGKNPEWKKILEAFEYYPNESMLQRKKIISRFAALLKSRLNPDKKPLESAGSSGGIYDADIAEIKGTGSKIKYLLNKLGIFTVFDLISFYPKKYIDYSKHCKIRELEDGKTVTVCACVTAVKYFETKKGLTVIKVTLRDETGIMDLNFFFAKSNRYTIERYKAQFPLNENIIVSGTAKFDKYSCSMTIDKPQCQSAGNSSGDNLNTGRIVPVYPLTENLNIKTFRKIIYTALEEYAPEIKNIVPDEIISRHNMMDRCTALKTIHFPDNETQLEKARIALVYEELFLLQMKMLLIKKSARKSCAASALNIKEDGLVMKFIKSLPYKLTDAQMRAVNEILNDINSDKPMQRLLQGDVGSGKTVVSCIMLLAAIENGYQTAVMAPTEILAQQHYNNFADWLKPFGINIGLFTSSNSKKQRIQLETGLRTGFINIAIGTHALIQEDIEFKKLGAAVIDEQHRFGVKQRNMLRAKAVLPHMLTMTATPIPRTLALTVHGDLDLTVIDELPKGRKPVKTVHIPASQRRKAHDLIRQEVKNGHQAYIVFPLIEESETISAKAAAIEAEKLQNGVFKDLKIGLLHGRLKPEEKDKVMADFKNKLYDILVCTTVVEVGVDVPNASVIIIENAERFGLSQLHQLRGRVGRSSVQSYCVLVSSSRSEDAAARLDVMVQTNDGFVIAEKDLELRGPGEFLGVKQSGIAELHLADLTKDAYILELARKEAAEYIETHKKEDYSEELKAYLNSILSAVQELGITD